MQPLGKRPCPFDERTCIRGKFVQEMQSRDRDIYEIMLSNQSSSNVPVIQNTQNMPTPPRRPQVQWVTIPKFEGSAKSNHNQNSEASSSKPSGSITYANGHQALLTPVNQQPSGAFPQNRPQVQWVTIPKFEASSSNGYQASLTPTTQPATSSRDARSVSFDEILNNPNIRYARGIEVPLVTNNNNGWAYKALEKCPDGSYFICRGTSNHTNVVVFKQDGKIQQKNNQFFFNENTKEIYVVIRENEKTFTPAQLGLKYRVIESELVKKLCEGNYTRLSSLLSNLSFQQPCSFEQIQNNPFLRNVVGFELPLVVNNDNGWARKTLSEYFEPGSFFLQKTSQNGVFACVYADSKAQNGKRLVIKLHYSPENRILYVECDNERMPFQEFLKKINQPRGYALPISEAALFQTYTKSIIPYPICVTYGSREKAISIVKEKLKTAYSPLTKNEMIEHLLSQAFDKPRYSIVIGEDQKIFLIHSSVTSWSNVGVGTVFPSLIISEIDFVVGNDGSIYVGYPSSQSSECFKRIDLFFMKLGSPYQLQPLSFEDVQNNLNIRYKLFGFELPLITGNASGWADNALKKFPANAYFICQVEGENAFDIVRSCGNGEIQKKRVRFLFDATKRIGVFDCETGKKFDIRLLQAWKPVAEKMLMMQVETRNEVFEDGLRDVSFEQIQNNPFIRNASGFELPLVTNNENDWADNRLESFGLPGTYFLRRSSSDKNAMVFVYCNLEKKVKCVKIKLSFNSKNKQFYVQFVGGLKGYYEFNNFTKQLCGMPIPLPERTLVYGFRQDTNANGTNTI